MRAGARVWREEVRVGGLGREHECPGGAREAALPRLALALLEALLPRVELAPPSLPLGGGGRALARRGGGAAERLALGRGGRGEQRAWGGRAARRREAAVRVALEVLRRGGGEARRHAVDPRAEGAVLLAARQRRRPAQVRLRHAAAAAGGVGFARRGCLPLALLAQQPGRRLAVARLGRGRRGVSAGWPVGLRLERALRLLLALLTLARLVRAWGRGLGLRLGLGRGLGLRAGARARAQGWD